MHDPTLYAGMIRLHILHHAAQRPVFGLWVIQELSRHGYRLSPGTLYPLLHGLERKSYLRSTTVRAGSSRRREYRTTPAGKRALRTAKVKVRELFGELLGAAAGGDGERTSGRKTSSHRGSGAGVAAAARPAGRRGTVRAKG